MRIFLPALLLTKIGSELHAGSSESARAYGIVLGWAIVCHVVSFIIGIAAHRCLGMPDWTTAAVMFNNTTSYPLLLIQALKETGVLGALVKSEDGTKDLGEAVERATAYFLVFATVSTCVTFAVGPRLIDGENAPEPGSSKSEDGDVETECLENADGSTLEDAEDDRSSRDGDSQIQGHDEEANEHTHLLHSLHGIQFTNPFYNEGRFVFSSRQASAADSVPDISHRRASFVPRPHWRRLGPRTRWWLLFIADFFNMPLMGAIIGVIIGFTPALHRAFFSDSKHGGIFNAWLTPSLKQIGGLFVPLPVVVAGVSLYTAMKEARQNRRTTSGLNIPWGTVLFILSVRFIIWPVVSIATIYALASQTTFLGDDPMLWFALMLMPTGPPAMKLITLVQVSDADEEDERSIAKLLTVCPLILSSSTMSLT